MPYVSQEVRKELDKGSSPQTAGELTYLIYKLMISFLRGRKAYDHYNTVVGSVECAKMEFYRKEVAPYEDTKIKENGDVS